MLACALLRLAGVDGTALTIAQFVPTLALIVAVALLARHRALPHPRRRERQRVGLRRRPATRRALRRTGSAPVLQPARPVHRRAARRRGRDARLPQAPRAAPRQHGLPERRPRRLGRGALHAPRGRPVHPALAPPAHRALRADRRGRARGRPAHQPLGERRLRRRRSRLRGDDRDLSRLGQLRVRARHRGVTGEGRGVLRRADRACRRRARPQPRRAGRADRAQRAPLSSPARSTNQSSAAGLASESRLATLRRIAALQDPLDRHLELLVGERARHLVDLVDRVGHVARRAVLAHALADLVDQRRRRAWTR